MCKRVMPLSHLIVYICIYFCVYQLETRTLEKKIDFFLENKIIIIKVTF
jgi:hypothetical protein